MASAFYLDAGSMMGQAVPLVHPGLAMLALAAGGVPILIHLLNRMRFRRVRWAAMRFLLNANKRSVRRVRIEQWLLLLSRVALVVLFGLALARPFLSASMVGSFGAVRSHHVLVLDNSLSMQALEGGRTRFSRAVEHALGWIETLPRNDAVSIVTLASPASSPVDFGSYDRRMVREQLGALEVTQRSTDVEGAARLAGSILAESQSLPENRSIHVVTDLCRGAWSKVGRGGVAHLNRLGDLVSEPRTDLVVTSVSTDAPANVGLTAIDGEQMMSGAGQPVRINATVTNFGDAPARGLNIEFRRGDELVRRTPLANIDPQKSMVATVSIELQEPGTHLVEAMVVPPGSGGPPAGGAGGDALPADDVRSLSLEKHHRLDVLLVDGSPGRTLLSGSAGYLAIALAPRLQIGSYAGGVGDPGGFDDGRMPIEPKVVSTTDLIGESLSDYAVIFLCDVPQFAPETWTSLEHFVAGGGGLAVIAGPHMDVANYNRHGYGEESALIPGEWGEVVEEIGAAALTFSDAGLTHPIVRVFQDHPMSGLFLSRISAYRKFSAAEGSEVLLEMSNGEPALVASTFGRGKVLVATTSLDMAWSNVPAKGDFVALVLNSISFLSPSHGAERNVLVGSMILEPLGPAEASLPLAVTASAGDGGGYRGTGTGAPDAVLPSKIVQTGEDTMDGMPNSGVKGLALSYGPTEQGGGFLLSIGSRQVDFAVTLDPSESDLAAMSEESVVAALDGEVSFHRPLEGSVEHGTSMRAGELSVPFLTVVLLLLMLEMWMAYSFGSRRSLA